MHSEVAATLPCAAVLAQSEEKKGPQQHAVCGESDIMYISVCKGDKWMAINTFNMDTGSLYNSDNMMVGGTEKDHRSK